MSVLNQQDRQPDPADTGSYYIPATSAPLEQSPRTLKHGDAFGLFDQHGDIIPGELHGGGLYHRDTRILSEWRLLLDGHRPLLLSSTIRENNSALTADLTNPDFYRDGVLQQPRDTLHIVRTIYLWDNGCHQRLALRNFSDRAHCNRVQLRFDADFVDIFEVRGHRRQQCGRHAVRVAGSGCVELSYIACDGHRQATRIEFDPPPTRLDEQAAEWEVCLQPGQHCTLFSRIAVDPPAALEKQGRGFLTGLRASRTALRKSSARATAIVTSNEIFNEVLRRSVADLYMLMTDTEHGPYPYAGVPWYSTPFGRDGIITALQMLWVDPQVAKGVLNFLAHTQAQRDDPAADAQVGKILHEMRHGEMARCGEVPFERYYGSVDATPLFVLLAGRYYDRTGDRATLEALWPNIEAALAWIDGAGDPDGDGFVEYQSQRPDGLVNQGWKDSADAVFHADGNLAKGPIALVEVQAYVYAAKLAISRVARALGLHPDATRLQREAEQLKERFEKTFWSDGLGSYVLALDGDKQPCLVRSSNAGQVLLSGIASPERARVVADDLISRRFFSGWGIRTIASGEARYNPMSYHNGSVWPHDNALIALGLSRYGHTDAVEQVFEGLFLVASFMDLRRLPELFCGFRRKPGQGPTAYPVACSPQAWAAAAPLALLQASLGLRFDIDAHAIVLQHPRLPEFLDEVRLHKLRLGDDFVDLLLRRHHDDVAVNVLRRSGSLVVDIRV